MSDISKLIQAVANDEPQSAEKLLPLVYDELRRLAHARLANEKPGQTLDATGLVHEAYLRLVGDEDAQWHHRGHFFGAAAEAMRRILIDSARKRKRQKHGGNLQRVEMDGDVADSSGHDDQLLELDEALGKLQTQDQRKADVIKLRFFAGLTNEETAKVLYISPATAMRDWQYARAWLKREMSNVDKA